MFTTRLVLTTVLALSAGAAPLSSEETSVVARDSDNTFGLHVYNNCKFVKEVGLYTVTPDFRMDIKAEGVNIPPGGSHTFRPNFYDVGMRLSGHMEWGTDGQWRPQALLEFGYSKYTDTHGTSSEGTAYDLSFMQPVPDPDIGMGVWPIDSGQGSATCETKVCFPWDCPLDQGWTNPNQVNVGSPADTVCYKGKSDFKVVYCP